MPLIGMENFTLPPSSSFCRCIEAVPVRVVVFFPGVEVVTVDEVDAMECPSLFVVPMRCDLCLDAMIRSRIRRNRAFGTLCRRCWNGSRFDSRFAWTHRFRSH